jgi:hypothetical protein
MVGWLRGIGAIEGLWASIMKLRFAYRSLLGMDSKCREVNYGRYFLRWEVVFELQSMK